MNNDLPPIQAAIDAAATSGGTVYLPAGHLSARRDAGPPEGRWLWKVRPAPERS